MRSNRSGAILLAGSMFLVATTKARALPPPMTDAEMMQAADLVVDATCVNIICEGPPVADTQKITTTYLSTLFPTFSYKGGLPNSIQIRGYEYDYFGPPPVGGWHQGAVPEGWAGKLYLEQLVDGTYSKVWWNAMVEDATSSTPQPLPNCEVTDPDGGLQSDGGPDGAVVADAEATDTAVVEPDGSAIDGAVIHPDGGPQRDGASTDAGTTDPSISNGGCDCDASGAGSTRGDPLLWPLFFLLVAVFLRRRP